MRTCSAASKRSAKPRHPLGSRCPSRSGRRRRASPRTAPSVRPASCASASVGNAQLDPRDLARHRAPEEVVLGLLRELEALGRRGRSRRGVFSGASIVIRASMWSEAKRSISDSSPSSSSGASAAQAGFDGHITKPIRRIGYAPRRAISRCSARIAGPRERRRPDQHLHAGLDVEAALDEQLGVRVDARDRPRSQEPPSRSPGRARRRARCRAAAVPAGP